jgi:putative ATP-dependent endonuclease of the OLD family
MRIKRVHIQNYRSIKDLEFYPSDICALVGENNAGKTNILCALNLLLGEVYPSKRSIEPADYFEQDTSKAINIEVEFDRDPSNIEKVWFTAPWDGRTEAKVQYAGNGSAYNLTNEVKDRCALVYLDANRNLDYHLGFSSWTLFGRIIRKLDEDFRRQYPKGDPTDTELRSHFDNAMDVLKTDLFERFEATIQESFSGQIRRTTHHIELQFQAFDPINYYRAIRLLLNEHEQLKATADAGQGMKNLVLLALFRTYAKVFRDDGIIAIEEPEIYLHPHAQRSLYSLFRELANNGAQVFYSTHSSAFVDIENFDHITLVEKIPELDEDGQKHHQTTVRQVPSSVMLARRQTLFPTIPMTEQGMRERYHNICTGLHGEGFFAKKIVLVEGITEEFSLPIYATSMGYDFDAQGVSIINANGKDNLCSLYLLYTSFGIPTYLIFDGDHGTTDQSKLTRNRDLLRMLGEPETDNPDQAFKQTYAVLQAGYEDAMRRALERVQSGLNDQLMADAARDLGSRAGKGLVARYMARKLVERPAGFVPAHIAEIITQIQALGEPDAKVEPEEEFDEYPF